MNSNSNFSQIPRGGYCALRRGRTAIPGGIYVITFVTKDRTRLFADFEFACAASATLGDPMLWRNSNLLAWVLMPDHWHGLVQLGAMDTLATAIRRVKSVSAKRLNAMLGSSGAVWSPGFHDHALRSESEVLPTARYVVANPLRAGLVRTVLDYPFWNASWL